jgi:hypothetical protein
MGCPYSDEARGGIRETSRPRRIRTPAAHGLLGGKALAEYEPDLDWGIGDVQSLFAAEALAIVLVFSSMPRA